MKEREELIRESKQAWESFIKEQEARVKADKEIELLKAQLAEKTNIQ